ncbi:MAG: hypothetical protein AB1479_00015 [Pseudomonadota bacterium]
MLTIHNTPPARAGLTGLRFTLPLDLGPYPSGTRLTCRRGADSAGVMARGDDYVMLDGIDAATRQGLEAIGYRKLPDSEALDLFGDRARWRGQELAVTIEWDAARVRVLSITPEGEACDLYTGRRFPIGGERFGPSYWFLPVLSVKPA